MWEHPSAMQLKLRSSVALGGMFAQDTDSLIDVLDDPAMCPNVGQTFDLRLDSGERIGPRLF